MVSKSLFGVSSNMVPESGPQQNKGVSRGTVLSRELLSQALRRSCPGRLIAKQSSETAKKRKSEKRSRHLHGAYSKK